MPFSNYNFEQCRIDSRPLQATDDLQQLIDDSQPTTYKFFYSIKNHTQAALDLVIKHLPFAVVNTTVHDDHFYLLEIHDWATFITTVCNILAGWDLTNFLTDLKPYKD